MSDDSNGLVSVLRAARFTADAHRNQRRKDADATPYINHPLALAECLVSEGGVTDPVVLCAALLHDTVEDCGVTRDELAQRFGEAVAAIVMEVTDDKALPKAERKRLQIEHAGTASPAARLVKLADKIANLRDLAASPPQDWDAERIRAYFHWAAAVVAKLRGTNVALEAAFDAACSRCP